MSPESSFLPGGDPWLRGQTEQDFLGQPPALFAAGENADYERTLADTRPCWPVLPAPVEDEALR